MEDVLFLVWVALAAALIPYSSLAHASESFAPASACGGQVSQFYYSASFQWQGAKRIVIGTIGREGQEPVLVAQIWAGDRCAAVCTPQNLETDGPARPAALDMKCQSNGFVPAAQHATVLWSGRYGRFPKLRFGTWLSGYQHAPVLVEVDAYSRSDTPARQIAAR